LYFYYFNRFIPPTPGWGDWRFVNHPDPWAGQLNLVQALTVQGAQIEAEVDQLESAAHATQVKIDDLYDQRAGELAALEDVTGLLLPLKADLDFHTKRLRDASAYLL